MSIQETLPKLEDTATPAELAGPVPRKVELDEMKLLAHHAAGQASQAAAVEGRDKAFTSEVRAHAAAASKRLILHWFQNFFSDFYFVPRVVAVRPGNTLLVALAQ